MENKQTELRTWGFPSFDPSASVPTLARRLFLFQTSEYFGKTETKKPVPPFF
jgi:hypothetical protein